MSSKRKQAFPPSVEDIESESQFDTGEVSEEHDEFDQSLMTNSSRFTSPDSLVTDLNADTTAADNLDYDSVSSPGGSSTASGPTYIRPAGFDHHAQEILASPTDIQTRRRTSRSSSVLTRHSVGSHGSLTGSSKAGPAKKKKGFLSADIKELGVAASEGGSVKRIEGVAVISHSSRSKQKKEPLPMKQRALPQSFWQQPNLANPQPPGVIVTNLPPLPLEDCNIDLTPVEDVSISSTSNAHLSTSNSSTSSHQSESRVPSRIISHANTDLLFSLFNSVEEDEAQRRIHVVKRGRPKKTVSHHVGTRIVRDEDPCLNSASVESILPLIPERAGTAGSSVSGVSVSGSSSGSGTASIGRNNQGTQVQALN